MEAFIRYLEPNHPKTNICFPLATGNGPQLETLDRNEYLETLRPSIHAIAVAQGPSNLRPKHSQRDTGVEKVFRHKAKKQPIQSCLAMQSGNIFPRCIFLSQRE